VQRGRLIADEVGQQQVDQFRRKFIAPECFVIQRRGQGGNIAQVGAREAIQCGANGKGGLDNRRDIRIAVIILQRRKRIKQIGDRAADAHNRIDECHLLRRELDAPAQPLEQNREILGRRQRGVERGEGISQALSDIEWIRHASSAP